MKQIFLEGESPTLKGLPIKKIITFLAFSINRELDLLFTWFVINFLCPLAFSNAKYF